MCQNPPNFRLRTGLPIQVWPAGFSGAAPLTERITPMSTIRRRSRSDAERRRFGGRTLVALVAAAALTLGPGAMSAFADDSVPQSDVSAPAEIAPPVDSAAPEPAPPVADTPAAPEVLAEEPPAEVTDQPAPSDDSAADPAPVDPAEEAPVEEADSDEVADARLAPAEENADAPNEAAKPGDDNPGNNIKVCHATEAEGHWVTEWPNANGVISGHVSNSHHDGRDIIPPFDYKDNGKTVHFAGQNWDAEGQAIYRNNCEKPQPPPQNPSVVVEVDQCMDPDGEVPSTVGIKIANLSIKLEYTLVVTGPKGFESTTPLTPLNGGAYVQQPVNGPGAYVATVTGKAGKTAVLGSQEFSVNECPKPPKYENPVVEVSVDQCVPPNGVVPTSVAITISKLNHRFTYMLEVTGPDGFFEEMEVTPGEDGTAFIELPVPGPGDYVATVTGTRGHQGGGHGWPGGDPEWGDDEVVVIEPDTGARAAMFPGEFEGPRHGGKTTLTGTADFTVDPACAVTPVVSITSSPAPMAALATTGSTSNGPDLTVALLVLLGAGSALAAVGARRSLKSRG